MKHRSILFLASLLVLPIIFATTAYADTTITKKQIQLVADFTLDNKANAGGTITKDYYVFPDTKGLHGGPGTIKVVSRSSCKSVTSTKIGSVYLSGLYNKWGTNYITLIGMGKQKGCYKISNSKLQKASGCSTPPGRSLTYQGTGQGNTDTINGYTFKVAGFSGGKIGVWNSSGTRVATYVIPKSVVSAEPENISIDGATGEVYINFASKVKGKRHSLWYKIDSSVFSKYTGKKGTSNPTKCKNSTSTSGSSSTTTSSVVSSSTSSSSSSSSTPNYTPSQSTYDGSVSTIFFGDIQDDGEGCGVYMILNLILDILTYGIGIAAIIGISISGIMYLTSKGNEANTTKAKRRIYEIVIGLAAYAVLYVALNFLLPGGNWNTSNTCKEASNSTSSSSSSSSSTGKTSSSKAQTEAAKKAAEAKTGTVAGRNLMTAAQEYASLLEKNNLKYCNTGGSNTWAKAKKKGCLNCAEYVSIAAQKAGVMKAGKTIWIGNGKVHNKGNLVSGKVKVTENVNQSIASLVKAKKLIPGDIVGSQSGTPHTMIYQGQKNGKYYFYSVNSKYNGTSAKTHTLKQSWVTGKTYSGSYKIGAIIRLL